MWRCSFLHLLAGFPLEFVLRPKWLENRPVIWLFAPPLAFRCLVVVRQYDIQNLAAPQLDISAVVRIGDLHIGPGEKLISPRVHPAPCQDKQDGWYGHRENPTAHGDHATWMTAALSLIQWVRACRTRSPRPRSRCAGRAARVPRHDLIVGELPDVVHAAAVKSKIVSYYKELQWFTLAPIPSDTRHTAG
jgi:hypothetical protein